MVSYRKQKYLPIKKNFFERKSEQILLNIILFAYICAKRLLETSDNQIIYPFTKTKAYEKLPQTKLGRDYFNLILLLHFREIFRKWNNL